MPASKDFLNFGKRVAAKMAPAANAALKKADRNGNLRPV